MLPPETKPNVSLFITDLDNTLWDWFHAWHASFSALLDGVADITGVPRENLEQEARSVHQRRGTSEYSWLLYELPSVIEYCGKEDPFGVFREVLHRQNSARLHESRLYDGVLETLQLVKKAGVPIVAYTESQDYWTKWRMTKLGLDGVIDCLYSSTDHGSPKGVSPKEKRLNPAADMSLRVTEHRHVPEGVLKPDPRVLELIIREYGVPASEVLYVGDSLHKDIAMGQAVGVMDAHALYGVAIERPAYEQLRRVSHWTQEDVDRERLAAPDATPVPSCVMTNGLDEILERFTFAGHQLHAERGREKVAVGRMENNH